MALPFHVIFLISRHEHHISPLFNAISIICVLCQTFFFNQISFHGDNSRISSKSLVTLPKFATFYDRKMIKKNIDIINLEVKILLVLSKICTKWIKLIVECEFFILPSKAQLLLRDWSRDGGGSRFNFLQQLKIRNKNYYLKGGKKKRSKKL